MNDPASLQPDFEALLSSPEFLRDPYPTYDLLRESAPVYRSSAWNSVLITGYDDCQRVLRDADTFVNSGRRAAFFDALPETTRREVTALYEIMATGMGNADPPDHTRLRGLVTKAFTPRVVAGMRPKIEATVAELLDARDQASDLDVVQDFAYPLPATIIADLLGFPHEDRATFKRWSDAIVDVQGTGHVSIDAARRANSALSKARSWLLALVDERRRHPRGDLLSEFAHAEFDGEKLSDADIVALAVIFMVGGHETTTALISSGVAMLLTTPTEHGRLVGNLNLIPSAVEEFLRLESPVQQSWRIASRDTTLSGVLIRKGELVRAMLGAANRDPQRFHDPNRLDIGRINNRHLAFTVGIHFCVGAPLARIEAQIAIVEFLRRYPRAHLSDRELQWQPNNFQRSLLRLLVCPGECSHLT